MSVRLLYLIMIRVSGWLVLLGRSQAPKDAEILVVGAENLCHLARCSAGRWLFSPAGTARAWDDLRLVGVKLIFLVVTLWVPITLSQLLTWCLPAGQGRAEFGIRLRGGARSGTHKVEMTTAGDVVSLADRGGPEGRYLVDSAQPNEANADVPAQRPAR